MTEEGHSEPITIPTTPNIFEDVVSVTPPNAESIELQHLHDDARFNPDYGEKDPVDDEHFTKSLRQKRQTPDYTDLTYEMYADPTYTRKRRNVEDPHRIDLDFPADSDSSSEAETARPVSDPDSVSTQITYVIISEDDDDDEPVNVMKSDLSEQTTEVIDLVIPSSDEGTSDSSSSDSVAERNRILGAIARTIRTKTRRNSASDESSSSSVQLLTRKRRQVPYYRLPDFLNYRVGRSVSDDSDDTEPDDDQGPNEKDLSMDETSLKNSDRVVPLPEFAYEFSELTRPASTYVDGKLQSYYVPDRQRRSVENETTTESVDVVTAFYPLGIDETKDNLSLPEGNFLGPRVYAKGELLQEEEPAATEVARPMKEIETIPVEDGSEIDNVYSAPVSNMNLPLVIPVVAPTMHPGEEPRIELSVPSGYVPYIIQLSPLNKTEVSTDQKTQTNLEAEETTTEKMTTPSPNPQSPTYLSSVPTIIVTPSTTSGNEESTQTSSLGMIGLSSEDGSSESSTTASWKSIGLTASEERESSSKQKRADWKSISTAPVGEIQEPRSQTASWKLASNSPTSGIVTEPTSRWQSVPVGEEELPKQRTATWGPISNAPVGVVEERTARIDTSSTAKWESVPAGPTEKVQTGRWTPVPVGEEELPKQRISEWEQISNAPVGDTEASSASSTSTSTSTSSDSVERAPPASQRDRSGRRMNTIPILEENSVMSPNGSFSYRYGEQ